MSDSGTIGPRGRVPEHGRRRWRRVTIVLAFVVLAFVALALGLFPQEPLRRLTERRLREAFGPDSRMGYLHVVPGRLTVIVEDLEIDAPGYHLVVPRARVRANPDLLLRRSLSFDAIQAEFPRVTLRPSPTPAEKSDLPTVRIDRIDLKGGQIVYEDRPHRVVVDGIEAHGSIGSGALDVSSTSGSVSAPRPLPLGPIRARVRVSSGMELDVESLEARVAGSRLGAHGAVGKLDDPDVDLEFEGDVDPADVLPRKAAAFDSRVAIEGSVSGKPEELDMTARLRGTAVGGELSGSVKLNGRRLEAGIEMRGGDLARLGRAFDLGSPPVRGWVTARVEAEGDLGQEIRFETKLEARALASGLRHRIRSSLQGSAQPVSRSLDARWRTRVETSALADASHLRSASFEAQGTARGPIPPLVDGRVAGIVALRTPSGPERVRWTGELRAHGRDVRGRLDGEGRTGRFHVSAAFAGSFVRALKLEARGELATLVPGSEGTLAASISASGPLSSLSGDGRVQGDAVVWNGVPVGTVLLEAHSVKGRGRVTLEVPDWRVRGDATIAPGRVRGDLRLEGSPLAGLSPLLPRPIEGRVAGQVTFDAPLAAPRRATLTANVTALDVTSGDLEARAARPFSVHLERQLLSLHDVAVEGPGVHLELSGSASLSRRTVDLAASGRLDLARAPLPAPWAATGTLVADARVQGDPRRPRMRGVARLEDLVLSSAGADAPLLSGRAEVRLEGDRLVLLPGELALAGGTLRVDGAVPLAAVTTRAEERSRPGPAAAAELRAEWSNVSIGTLLASAGGGTPGSIEGTLAGHVALRGPLQRPAAARGEIALRAEGLRVGELAVELSPVTGTLQGGALELSPVELGSGDVRLRTTARVDLERRSLVASSQGRVDLRTLSPLVEGASLGGHADVDVSVSGPFDALAGRGRIDLEQGSLRLRDVPQALTDGRGAVVLEGSRLVVPELTARLGGGTLVLTGSAAVAGARGVEDVRLAVTGRDLSLRYPADFKSRVHADLSLTGRMGSLLLAGKVVAERGLYDEDINVEDVLRVPPAAKEEVAPFLATIGLDVEVLTENPIFIRNNLAELGVSGRLVLRGDLASPAPLGRLEVEEGGKVFLQTREFTVEQGGLLYNGTLEPEIAVRAKTVITQPGDGDVEVTIVAEGPLMDPDLELTSQPEYSEKEIASLVATGRREVDLDSTAWVAGEHAAALLATRASRGLARGLEPLGFDEVTIQPQLLAREADPSARFTFAKHLSPRLRLIYSIGLNDAEERYFEGQYRLRIGRELTARLASDDEGILTYGIGQRWEFGAPPSARRDAWKPSTVRLESVLVRGDDAGILAGRVRRRAGDEVTPWDLQGDAERLERRLRGEGHLEALVSGRLEGDTATFTVRAGPRYVWEVRGLATPPDLSRDVLSALHEEEAFDKGQERLLAAARERGHLWARVNTTVEDVARGRVLVFDVETGPSVHQAEVLFPGASAHEEGDLLRAAGGAGALLTTGAEARERILEAYRDRHYLVAEVDPPRVIESPDRSRVTIEVPVREGPQARLAAVRFEGESRPEEELRAIAALETGVPVDPDAVSEAAGRVRDDYLKRGYAHLRLRPELVPSGSDLEVVFRIAEGEPSTVGAIVVSGLRRTRESLVRRQVDLRPGDPLDPRRMAAIEKRLLDLGIFSRAVVAASEDEPATVQVEVEEQGPFSVAYDIRFSSEERATTLLDAEAGNLGGIGLALGGRYRVGRDLRETRGSLHLPSLGRGGDTTASLFRTEDDRVAREGGTPEDLPFTEIQQGFQLQQTVHKGGRWNVLGGYTFKNISAAATGLRHDVAALSASVLRETRDSPLDAHEGSFLSLTLEGGARWLASDFDYFRVFAQFYTAKPIGDAFTWAQGYRLGLARGLEEQRDEQVSLSGRSTELFHAGGPNSLRGYARDSVGPEGPIPRVSVGGEALLVLNQELRYRHPSGLGGAVFYDVGNVFATLEDFGFDLRHSAGFGVRYESPFGLLRLDIAFPLNPRPADRGFQWHFTLGQAF